MTVAITRPSVETYDPNLVDGGPDVLIAAADNRVPQAQARITGRADFKASATTSTNDAITLANALINLSSKGVTFPANTVRPIRVRAWSKAGSAANKIAGFVETTFLVVGGTDPVVRVQTTGTGENVSPPTTTSNPSGVSTTFLPVAGTTTAPVYGHAIVAVTTTPAPDQVYVGVLGSNAADAGNMNWNVEVFVEPLQLLPVAATG